MLSTNGWTDMSGNLPQNARFYEYGNTINDVVMPNTTYGKTLTELEANNWINKDVIFAQQNGLVNWGSTWNYQAQFDALQLLLD